jgi:hypothetical protein
LGDGATVHLEDTVEVPNRDGEMARHVIGIEVWVAQVLSDEGLGTKQTNRSGLIALACVTAKAH